MKSKREFPWEFLDDYRGTAFYGEWPTLPEVYRVDRAQVSRPRLLYYIRARSKEPNVSRVPGQNRGRRSVSFAR